MNFLNYFCTNGNSLHIHFSYFSLSPTTLFYCKTSRLFSSMYKNQSIPFFFAKQVNCGRKMYIFLCVGLKVRNQNFFYLLLLLLPRFLPSMYLLFHLSIWHGLVYDFTPWGRAQSLKQKSCWQLCVAQRQNKWNSNNSK